MIATTVLDQLAAAAVTQARAILLDRALSELPGVFAAIDPAGIRLTAPHLFARAWGTRAAARDPWLARFTRRFR
jgi:hypothetical protein